jgi:hypothetical protein
MPVSVNAPPRVGKSPQFGRFLSDADVVLIYISIEGIVSFDVTKSHFARRVRRSTAAFEKAPLLRLKNVIAHI